MMTSVLHRNVLNGSDAVSSPRPSWGQRMAIAARRLGAVTLGVVGGSCLASPVAAQQPTQQSNATFGSAQWITGDALARAADTAQWAKDRGALGIRGPFPLLRKSFTVPAGTTVRRATITVTALGSYQLSLNGHPVGNDVLTPGWTDYRDRVEYQTYDVTHAIVPGANALGAMVGEGWYGSTIGGSHIHPYTYGRPPVRLICALRITYANGKTQTVVSDTTWRSISGPIQMSTIYAGETYDARALPDGWNRATVDGHPFDDRAWSGVRAYPAPGILVEPQQNEPIQRVDSIHVVKSFPVGPDSTGYDVGQNMVGWVRVHVHGPAGATVHIRHAEILADDGRHLSTQNLRDAAATDTYTLSGHGDEVFEPHFTYHGFRFIEIDAPSTVQVTKVTGIVVHSNAPETITFESSDSLVNRLFKNIQWSLRGNLMSVPTDCPQRSERIGWTGDVEVFWPTATYLMDLRQFTHKWLIDLRDTQDEIGNGCYPMFSPHPYPIGRTPYCGGPGWADAGILVPYAAYRQYNDTSLVREHWASMQRYMTYIEKENTTGEHPYLWYEHNEGWGDWLPAGRPRTGGYPTRDPLLSTALWAADVLAMRDMARGIGNTAAEEQYAALYHHIQEAFANAYVNGAGVVSETMLDSTQQSIVVSNQTGYAMALRYGLVPEAQRAAAAKNLADSITANAGHLATGFLGTPRLLPALTEQGHDDVAYGLLLNTTYPSWLYMVERGATTMWEQWDGDRVAASFNHYAYGAVGEWILRYAVGITQSDDSAGFRSIVIRPHPDPLGRITHLGASYRSVVGTITSSWTVDPTTHVVTLDVTVPAHRTARVDVPVYDGTAYRYVSHQVTGGTHHYQGRP